MSFISNKWIEKVKKKKVIDKPIHSPEPKKIINLNISCIKTLRGLRK